MTPIEIAYFKHFMYDKGLEKSFLFYYRRNPIKGSPKGDKYANPESIEQFFLRTTVKDVIMKAFTFYPSGTAVKENSTFDYWKNIDDQWQDYMHSMADNIINDSWPQLRKAFAILRQNWDVPAYWRKENFESTEEVYQRMHIDLPLPENCWEHGWQPKQRTDAELIKFDIQDAKDGDVIVRVHKRENGHITRQIILFRDLRPCEIEGVLMQMARSYAYYICDRCQLKIGDEIRPILVNPEAQDVAFRLAFDEERNVLMNKLADAGLRWNEKAKTLLSKDLSDEAIARIEEGVERGSYIKESDLALADDVPEIDFVEFDKCRRVVNALTKGIMSVNTRNHSWRVTINRTDTKEIKKKQVKYAMVGNTKAGDTMLMLCNNSKGIPITYNTDDYYNVNSRQFCDHLKRLLSISDDLAYLRIEKVSEKIDSITYKITIQ